MFYGVQSLEVSCGLEVIMHVSSENGQAVFTRLPYVYQLCTCNVNKPGSLVKHHIFLTTRTFLKVEVARSEV